MGIIKSKTMSYDPEYGNEKGDKHYFIILHNAMLTMGAASEKYRANLKNRKDKDDVWKKLKDVEEKYFNDDLIDTFFDEEDEDAILMCESVWNSTLDEGKKAL